MALWVVDESRDRVFPYSFEGQPLDGGFFLIGPNHNSTGFTTDGTSFWVLDKIEKKVFRYDLNGTSGVGHDLQDPPGNDDLGHLEGITTDGLSLWVLDKDEGVFRYSTTGQFREKSFTLKSENSNAAGITTDGSSFWVVDRAKDEVFRYTMAGILLSSFSVAPSINQPQGIATDGTNIWVVEKQPDRIYPFGLDGGAAGPVITGVYEGSYSWYVDPDGKVKSLYFFFPESDSTGFQTAYP